ncbi:hypothetical protein [Nocardia sp. NPDC050710]|uniref:hypothetical protein n=1 Tax=Nocardia sp. NPDC050710 TaxID=3157220 RepID=UPI0033E72EC7
MQVWDLTTGNPVCRLVTDAAHEVLVWPARPCPAGRPSAVAGGNDNTVRVWDLTTGAAVGPPMTGHTGPVLAVATAILPDKRLVAVTRGYDSTVRGWDLATATPIGGPLTGHTNGVVALALGHRHPSRWASRRGHRRLRQHRAGVGPHHHRTE